MAMFERFNNAYRVEFSGGGDACYFCCKEYLESPDKDEDVRTMQGAELKLRGHLKGQRVWHFRNYTFCKKHLTLILNEMDPEISIKTEEKKEEEIEENV